MKQINIVYGSSQNYIFATCVSAASIAKCVCADVRIVFHLFDMGVEDKEWNNFCKIVSGVNKNCGFKRYVIPVNLFEGFEAYHGSMAPYLRLLAPNVLSDIDWVIYVDGDTLCIGDVAKLWEERDEGRLIVGSIDPPSPPDIPVKEDEWGNKNGIKFLRDEYVCAGLMLMNLRKMREMAIESKCYKFLNKYGTPPLIDQTTLNFVCSGYIGHLSKEWGLFSMLHGDYNLKKDAIIHYVHDLPWKRAGACQLMTDVVVLWYDFCEKVLKINIRYKYYNRLSFAVRRMGYYFLCLVPWVSQLHPYLKSHIRDVSHISMEEKTEIYKRWGLV